MSLRCASCKYATIRGNMIICSIFGEPKPHECTRYAPSHYILLSTPLSGGTINREAMAYD